MLLSLTILTQGAAVLDASFIKMALHHAPQHVHFDDADLVVED